MSDSFQSDYPLETWDVLVGRVKDHWDKASLRVTSYSDAPNRFAVGALLCAASHDKNDARRLLKVLSSQRRGKYFLLDCGLSPQEAQSLKGAELFIHVSMRQALPEGEFYLDQIFGMNVQTESGQDLGEVEEIFETPAHDIYSTPKAMIPAVPEYIIKRDFENNILIVRDLLEWD